MRSIEGRDESTDLAADKTSSKITELENANDILRDDLVYLQSQWIRNNSVFTNVPESAIEGQVETEEKIRNHLVENMRIAKEQVEKISFERVYIMVGPGTLLQSSRSSKFEYMFAHSGKR